MQMSDGVVADQQLETLVQVEFGRGFKRIGNGRLQPGALLEAVDKDDRATVDGKYFDRQPLAQDQSALGMPGVQRGDSVLGLVRGPYRDDCVGGVQRGERWVQLHTQVSELLCALQLLKNAGLVQRLAIRRVIGANPWIKSAKELPYSLINGVVGG